MGSDFGMLNLNSFIAGMFRISGRRIENAGTTGPG